MSSIHVWTLAGAVVPAGLLVTAAMPVFVASLVADGPSFGTSAGVLVVTLVLLVPAGAITGLATGLVDRALRGYVRRGALAARRGRAVGASLVIFTLVTVLATALLAVTATSPRDVASGAALGGALALVPASAAYVLYRRLPAGPAPRR